MIVPTTRQEAGEAFRPAFLDDGTGKAENLEDVTDVSQSSTTSDFLLHQYMNEVNAVPLLSHEQTMALFRNLEEIRRHIEQLEAPENLHRAAREQKVALEKELSETKEKLVTANLRLVVYLANRYQNRGVPIQDLVQEGNIGLIRAIDKFDYTLGYRFSTYATWWIRQGMLRAIHQQGRLIRIPTHMLEKFQRYVRDLDKGLQEDPSGGTEDGFQGTQIDGNQPDMVFLMEVIRDPLSLDAPMTDEGLDLKEVTGDGNQSEPEARIIERDLREKLRAALSTLTLREELILRLRYGIDLPASHTLEEVGQLFQLTKERIRQIEARALRHLHRAHAA